jgi:t-SNARE complex subunit (syntaxin)
LPQGAVEHNVGAASRAAKRAEELHAVNRASCWQTCVVLTVVMVVFCWMVVLIRTSRDRLRPRL